MRSGMDRARRGPSVTVTFMCDCTCWTRLQSPTGTACEIAKLGVNLEASLIDAVAEADALVAVSGCFWSSI